jgi:hypothetical protein
MLRLALRQTLVALTPIAPAPVKSPAERRGRTYALTNSARCHSIDRVTPSTLKIAPHSEPCTIAIWALVNPRPDLAGSRGHCR